MEVEAENEQTGPSLHVAHPAVINFKIVSNWKYI